MFSPEDSLPRGCTRGGEGADLHGGCLSFLTALGRMIRLKTCEVRENSSAAMAGLYFSVLTCRTLLSCRVLVNKPPLVLKRE